MEFPIKKIKDAYMKANPKIRQILDDVWVSNLCAEIGKETNLRIDKIDSLIKIVGYVLLNLISINDFLKIIQNELGVDEYNAKEIAQRVDKMIFQKVRGIVTEQEIDVDFVDNTIIENDNYSLIKDIENEGEDNGEQLSFKEKFNKVVEKKAENKIVDPYLEPVD